MKKILAMMLTAAMMLSMGTAAMAANLGENDEILTQPTVNEKGESEYQDAYYVEIKKTYIAIDSDTTITDDSGAERSVVSPKETFTFTAFTPAAEVEGNDEAEFPSTLPSIVSIEATEGDAVADPGKTYTTKITLPEYTEVGIYKYTFKENNNDYQGVTYYDKEMTLVVTVVQEGTKVRVAAVHCESPVDPSYPEKEGDTTGNKTDTFTNTYEAGDISIKKVLDGNMAEKDQYFTVKVTIADGNDGDTIHSTITSNASELSYSGTETDVNPETLVVGVNTFKIKGEETIEIYNLPVGATYTVEEVEANANGYTTTYTLDDANVTAAEGETVVVVSGEIGEDSDNGTDDVIVITNTKTSNVDTGISVDSIPYLAMLGVVAVGGAGVVVSKKRRSED